MTPKYLALAFCALALAGCPAVTSTDEAKAPAEARSGFLGLSRTDDITVEGSSPFKGMDQIVVGSFKVGFVESKVEKQRAGGGLFGSGFGGNATAGLELSGVTIETMQKVVDAAYDDFLFRLTAAGYRVESRDVLLASPDFQRASSDTSPLQESASFFGSSTGMTYVAPRSIGNIHWFLGEAGKTGGFGFANASTAATTFAGKTGIRVLSVFYTVDFANSDGYGGQFRNSAAVEVGQSLSLAPGGGITVNGGGGDSMFASNHFAHVKLGQPIYSDQSFAEVVTTTGDVDKGVEVGVNVIRAIGGLGTNQRRDFQVRADPAKYGTLATGLLADANEKLVARMSGLR